jgi:hypothetical protein
MKRYNLDHALFDCSKVYSIQMNGWKYAAPLTIDSDTYTDSGWSGCDYRCSPNCATDYQIAINITITGQSKYHPADGFVTTVRIELVKDGEENQIESGKVYSKFAIQRDSIAA